jgi:hypothetical protein
MIQKFLIITFRLKIISIFDSKNKSSDNRFQFNFKFQSKKDKIIYLFYN